MASSVSSTFDSMFEELLKQLRSEGNVKEISDEFSQLRTNQGRAAFALNLKNVKDTINVNHGGGKSNVDALKLKDLGNKQFQKGVFQEAVKLYTKSIAYAPTSKENSRTSAICFANRSAALVHMKLYKLALLDIERAISSDYPDELSYKLLERKGKCFKELGDVKLAAIEFEKALAKLPSSNLVPKKLEMLQKELASQLDECVDSSVLCDLEDMNLSEKTKSNGSVAANQPQLSEVHPIYTSLSEACDVAYTKEQGRFIVAKRDMKPGEIILIEKPFASVLLFEHNLNHCHHCFKRTLAPIPSTYSYLVMFCSETCKTLAEVYHKYEWSALEAIVKSGVGKFGYLALRTVTKCGPEFLRKFCAKVEEGPLKPDSEQKYESKDYNTIYNLVTHANDRSGQDLFRRSVMATFLLRCLDQSGFFDTLAQDTDVKEFREFVAGLLLSHLQAFPCNAHEISELELMKSDIAASLPLEIGAGIYSTLSLFNHSCDPVANRNFYGDTCVVRTILPVKKGDEISDNYGAVYAVHSLPERQGKLMPQYYFRCACRACVGDWPLYPEINHQAPVWKCSHCGTPLPPARDNCTVVVCPKCDIEEEIDKKMRALEKSSVAYQSAFDDLLDANIEKALPAFLIHLQILDTLLCRPWRDFNNCQEAIKQCFSIMGNCVEV